MAKFNHFYEVQGSWLVKSDRPLTDTDVREICMERWNSLFNSEEPGNAFIETLAVHQIDEVEPNPEDLI